MTAGASSSPAVDRDSLLRHSVLESMSEGVMTVDSDARIGIFNPAAAARLLGLARAEVQGNLVRRGIFALQGAGRLQRHRAGGRL